MKKMKLLPVLMPVVALSLAACAPNNFEGLQQMSMDTASVIGCQSFESKTWDAINNYLLENKQIPDADEVKQHLKSALKAVKGSEGNLTEEQLELLSADVSALYETFLVEVPDKEKVQDSEDLLAVLSALELGDHTTPSKVELQNKVAAKIQRIKSDAQLMQLQCGNPQADQEEASGTGSIPVEVTASTLPAALFGANWTMATAYQTCQALSEPAMTAATADAKGISIVGKHKDGIGSKRIVASATELVKTHPYYKNVNNYGASCLNMRSTPLIYDYGGKPFISTKTGTAFNLFKDAGNGTKALGIDCSGYIYASLATAGLRLAPLKNMKATGILGVSSTMYVEPQYNKMTCLQKISVSPQTTIRSGDIVAVRGHVLMVDSVGNDPLGLNYAKTANDCAKLSSKNFNFVIIQSSNSKDGIGINRYEARDYLNESDKMQVGLQKYAYYACLARFNNKVYTPNLGTLSVVRHKGTPECRGSRIALSQEACIQNCPQLSR